MPSPKIQDDLTQVVCLVLMDADGRILATQRPEGKTLARLWEFPGGKVEPGESPADALRREMLEELGLRTEELQALPPTEHVYPFGAIRLIPFLQRCKRPPDLTLHEHRAAKWLEPHAWPSLDWAPADIPIIEHLLTQQVAP